MIFPKNALFISLCASFGLATAFGANAYINQVGYSTNGAKELALVGATGDKVEFVNSSGEVVFSKAPGAASYWTPSGQDVRLVDFSDLDVAGVYKVRQNNQVLREDLKILDKPYEEVLKASLKFFYYQRASMALEEAYAGKWKRAAGHTNSTALLHNSTGETGSIQSSKGWYDAGDYGRYIVNSGISTYTLLALYEHYPEYFKKLKWNIPADGTLPDLLAEIKYNLDWMLTMQSKSGDGSIYHKLTTLGFSGTVMPANENAGSLYAIGKSSTAAYDFAAVMAVAYRVYKEYDEAYANKMLAAAEKAYSWAVANHEYLYTNNPEGVETGKYEDENADDEKSWAAVELYLSTGKSSYKQGEYYSSVPGWQNVTGLTNYEKALHSETSEHASAVTSLKSQANDYANNASSGFGVPIKDFYWGSNSNDANQGVLLLHAYYVTKDVKYLNAARKALDYLLGKNPLDMSFVTGYGTKSPMHPHHRPSQADGITDPVPGMLVGGPQPGQEDAKGNAWDCPNYSTGHAATTYYDNDCSYATNEVAINWNAPLAYLAGALEALDAGFFPFSEDKGTLPEESSSSVAENSSSSVSSSSEKSSSSSTKESTCKALTTECYSEAELCEKGIAKFCKDDAESSSSEGDEEGVSSDSEQGVENSSSAKSSSSMDMRPSPVFAGVDALQAKIYRNGNMIVSDKSIVLFDAAGHMVRKSGTNMTLDGLQKGVYIACSGANTLKIAVK